MEERVTETAITALVDINKESDENAVKLNSQEISEIKAAESNELESNENTNAGSLSKEAVPGKCEEKQKTPTGTDKDNVKCSDNGVVAAGDSENVTEEMGLNDDEANTVPNLEQGNGEGSQVKNYKNVILEDWDFEIPQTSASEANDSVSAKCVASYNNNSNNNNNNNNNNNDKDNSDVCEDHQSNMKNEEDCISDCLENKAKPTDEVDSCEVVKSAEGTNGVIEAKAGALEKKSDDSEKELIKPVLDKKKNPLKYSNLIVSNQDIVEILDNSVERVCRPIIPAKDIFLSIELTKHLNKKLSPTTHGKKNAFDTPDTKNVANSNDSGKKVPPDYHAKLSKTVEDSKTVSKDKELSQKDGDNALDSSTASENMKEEQVSDQIKKGKRKTVKKNINLGDEMERTIALRQLRDEFPSTRKRSHTTKKVNHIPFLASSVLEKALTSTVNSPNKSGVQRRRPCYLPDDAKSEKEEANETTPSDRMRKKKGKEINENEFKKSNKEGETRGNNQKDVDMNDLSNSSTPVVRTYSIKRKSTDSENEVISALQTFISASKQYQAQDEDSVESKPKKQKTVQRVETQKVGKTTPKKNSKTEGGVNKKRNLELEKLLGDEGAVRMLYETQHKDDNNRLSGKKSRTKTTLGLKKDLMLKTKLVKNAVLRLSGAASDGISLRGKRRSVKIESETAPEPDSLFVTSTPNVILYKPKKKQRAEASKILYRHSSSESFESLEGYRRSSFEVEGANSTNNDEGALVNGDLFKKKTETEEVDDLSGFSNNTKIAKQTKVFAGKRVKKLKKKKERKSKLDKEKINQGSTESLNTTHSKFQWSNVPVRKSCRPRVVSKKYSIWASTSMDSLSVESLGLKKSKKASQELGKKLNYKELRILQHGNLVQIILAPSSTVLKNSFNEQVLTELQETFEFLAEQESCSAILLTSSGSTFCQGIDLNYVLSVEEDDRKHSFGNLLNCIKKLILCLSNYKKPIIAGVHSVAIGLGVTLLAYCDIVICSDRASFYTPYARLGQLSEGAATVTFPRINRNLAAELLYKSEKLAASEALRLGLVSQIIPEDRFEEELMSLARRIASQSSQAMESMKLLINKLDLERIVETLDAENRLVLEHWCSNECINNIIKFLNSGEVQFRQLDVP